MGHRRGISLAIDACKEYVIQVCDGVSTQPTVTSVIRSYIKRVLDADFYEHLPLLNHYNHTDPQVIEARVEELRPYLDAEVELIVSQIKKSARVDHLRKQSRDRERQMPDFGDMDIAVPEGWEVERDA